MEKIIVAKMAGAIFNSTRADELAKTYCVNSRGKLEWDLYEKFHDYGMKENKLLQQFTRLLLQTKNSPQAGVNIGINVAGNQQINVENKNATKAPQTSRPMEKVS